MSQKKPTLLMTRMFSEDTPIEEKAAVADVYDQASADGTASNDDYNASKLGDSVIIEEKATGEITEVSKDDSGDFVLAPVNTPDAVEEVASEETATFTKKFSAKPQPKAEIKTKTFSEEVSEAISSAMAPVVEKLDAISSQLADQKEMSEKSADDTEEKKIPEPEEIIDPTAQAQDSDTDAPGRNEDLVTDPAEDGGASDRTFSDKNGAKGQGVDINALYKRSRDHAAGNSESFIAGK
jgi:hypothetical protein